MLNFYKFRKLTTNFDDSYISSTITVNGITEDINLNYLNQNLLEIDLTNLFNINNNFINPGSVITIDELKLTNFSGTFNDSNPNSTSDIFKLSKKYSDHFSLNHYENENLLLDFYVLQPSLNNTNSNSMIYTTSSIQVVEPIYINEPDDGNVSESVTIMHAGSEFCLNTDEGVIWDTGYPISYISVSGMNGLQSNKVVAQSYQSPQSVCFDVLEDMDNNEFVYVENLRVRASQNRVASYGLNLTFNGMQSVQDRRDDWLQVINFSMSSIDDQTFVPGTVDPIDNKITIRIDQDIPNVFYSDATGLRFKIPYSLDAYWDLDNTNIEVISQSNGSNIQIGDITYSNNQGTDLEPMYKYLDIVLLNNFENTEFVVLDGFYITPVSPSNGRLSVSLDGSENSLIVFDNKVKYVADMDVYISDSRKYFLNDSGLFSKLPVLNIKESESASIINQSIIYLDLPNGISWNDESITNVSNNNLELFTIEKDPNLDNRLQISNIEIDLDEIIQIDGLMIDNLSSVSDGFLDFTIDYSQYNNNPFGTNTVTIIGRNNIQVLDPNIYLDSSNDNIAYRFNESSSLFSIHLDNDNFFDDNYKLILNIDPSHSDYFTFNELDSISGINYDFISNNQLAVSILDESLITNGDSFLSIPISIQFSTDYCSLTPNQYLDLKNGVSAFLTFTYEFDENINTNIKYLNDPITLFSPIIADNSTEINFGDNGYLDVSFAIQKDLNLNTLNDIFTLRTNNYDFNFNSNDISEIIDSNVFCEESANSVEYQRVKILFPNEYSEIVFNSCVNNNENNICNLNLLPKRTELTDDINNFSNDLVTFNIEGHGGDGTLNTIYEDYFECPVNFEISDMVQETLLCGYEGLIWNEENAISYFNQCTSNLGSTILGIYVYEDNCNRSSKLPLALQFIQDETSPIFSSNFENLDAIGKNNSGHEYFYKEMIDLEFKDDLIVEDGIIFFNNGTSENYINISDSLRIDYTINWESQGYSDQILGSFSCNQGFETNECAFNLTFENLLEMDLFDEFSPFLNNVDRVKTSIDFSIIDGSGNQKDETIYFTVLYNESNVISDDAYNFPNPFSNIKGDGTTIRYLLTRNVNYGNFIILDASGKTVLRTPLTSENLLVGTHYIHWDGYDSSSRKLSSGIYFGFLEFEGEIGKRIKMVIRN